MNKVRPLNDVVYTERSFAKRVIDHFQPSGTCLDPCKGEGVFYDQLPSPKDWCEVSEGKDFLTYSKPVDWVITNPPWSSKAYRSVAQHSFALANNVVFLVRAHNAFGTFARHNDYLDHGHRLKEIVLVPWKEAGFPPEGFALGLFHWQKNYTGDCKFTYWHREDLSR